MKKMLKEGVKLYYIVNAHMYEGNAIEVQKTSNGCTFAIDSYGSCEGNFRIDASVLGIRVFLDREKAQEMIDKGQVIDSFSCG